MLISVHLPKTAGTSFLETLRQQFGDQLLTSYDDRPLHQTPARRRGNAALGCLKGALGQQQSDKLCLHGHFMPLKYRFLRSTSPRQFVTWMRDPIQRLLSHYYYWQRSYNRESAGPLQHRMMQEKWTLEEFGLRPELSNIYSEFLWGFPLEAFTFVGITEYYDTDLEAFTKQALQRDNSPDTNPRTPRANVNPKEAELYTLEDSLRIRLELQHARDMELYRRALTLRSTRLAP